MKTISRQFRILLIALGLATGALSPGCAHVAPVIGAVVTCSGRTIPISLVDSVYVDVMAENWVDLATNVIPLLSDGWADVTCILNYLSASNPETVPHIQKLKAAHVELRGGSACKELPRAGSVATAHQDYQKESPAGGAQRVPAGRAFAYAGESVDSTLKTCYRECGDNAHGAIAPPGGCQCFRRVGSTWRWVAAR